MKSRFRLWPISLGLRLMLFNTLLVFLPIAALLFLDVFEQHLLVLQEEAMAGQAQTLATLIGGRFTKAELSAPIGSLDSYVDRRSRSRVQIISRDGLVLADSIRAPTPVSNSGSPTVSRTDGPTRNTKSEYVSDESFVSILYQLGSWPFRLIRTIWPPPTPDAQPDSRQPSDNPAVRTALAGGYGSFSSLSPGQRSVTLYSALPIRVGSAVSGVVVVSQSTYRILQILYDVRLSLFKIFLLSVGAAFLISLLVTLTINRPLRRLRQMAETFVDQWGRPVGIFQSIAGPPELTALSTSLTRLGNGLTDHVRFIESFARDLAHEARNPLASIRAAAEVLQMGADPGQTKTLSAIITKEIDRLDQLLGQATELSRLDVEIERQPLETVGLGGLLSEVAQAWALRGKTLALELPEASVAVRGHRLFLRQVVDNLIDNAWGFSPPGATVSLRLLMVDDRVIVEVRDQGPGVLPDDQPRIFEKFHTTRRETGHFGVGLALVKTVAEAYGATVAVRNDHGAVFSLTFPRIAA